MTYSLFARGTEVEFLRRGVWQPAKVVAVYLDPNRRAGMGRVSYDVQTHPMFHPIHVAAKNVRVAAVGANVLVDFRTKEAV